MAVVLAFPVLLGLLMLQVGIFSRLTLLHGTADLVLLGVAAWSLHERVKTAWIWALFAGAMVSYISPLPAFAPMISYLLVVVIARVLLRRIWQVPILAMFLVTFLGTFVQHSLSILILQIGGTQISWQEGYSLVTLPSQLLNLLFALPVYTLFNDLKDWVYPVEIEA